MMNELESALEEFAPFLYRCGLMTADEAGRRLLTALGVYPVDGQDIADAITQASLDLEAELPRLYLLRKEAGDTVILERRELQEGGEEHFAPIPSHRMTDEDLGVLDDIIAAQGGSFKRYGYFRFDLALARQGMFNCARCGELWKSSRDSPMRCPRCRHPMPRKEEQGYVNVSRPVFDHGLQVPVTVNYSMTGGVPGDDADAFPSMDGLPHTLRDSLGAQPAAGAGPESLVQALAVLLDIYDSEYLNNARSIEDNDAVIAVLRRIEELVLEKLYDGRLIWPPRTASARPIGNWPVTPWVSFGIDGGGKRSFIGKEGSAAMDCMLLFDTFSGKAMLALVPVVKDLKRRHGQRWPLEFRPVKEEMRRRVAWLEAEGFRLDDDADIMTMPNSPGERMRQAAVAYRVFEGGGLDEEELTGALRATAKAYRELVLGEGIE